MMKPTVSQQVETMKIKMVLWQWVEGDAIPCCSVGLVSSRISSVVILDGD